MSRIDYVCADCGNFSYKLKSENPSELLFPNIPLQCKVKSCRGDLEEIIVLGATKLENFRRCPKYFEYVNILGLKSPKTIQLALGTIVHSFCENFYWKNYENQESFIKQFKGIWYSKVKTGEHKEIGNVKVFCKDEKERDSIFGAYGGIGCKMLGDFWDRHIGKRKELQTTREEKLKEFELQMKAERKGNKGRWKLTASERNLFFGGLNLFPKTEVSFQISWTDSFGRTHYLRGSIDRIDEYNGGYCISDYKSSKKVETQQTSVQMLERPNQFAIYSVSAEILFGQKPECIFVYYLRNDSVHSISINESHLETLAKDLTEVEETVKSGVFEKRTGYHCNSCDFHQTCIGSSASKLNGKTQTEFDKDVEHFWSEVEISGEGVE